MNTLLRKLCFIGVGLAFFASCKKDQSIDYFDGGAAPALTASVTDSIPLSYTNAGQNAVVFSWTNPEYQFASGISSQDVSYLMEIDTMGANFTNPNRKSITISKDLVLTLSQSTFNSYLLNQLLLTPGSMHTIQVRITASISAVSSTNLASNILTFTVIPFAIPPAVTPPSTGALFIIGDATPESPAWDNSPNLANQQFTQISATEYKITIALTGGKSYLFIPVDNGNWDHKFGGATDGTSGGGGALLVDGAVPSSNTPAPGSSGTYVVDVNFQTGKYTVTPQ
jgi:starch-binding outer membrane protein SusE/F